MAESVPKRARAKGGLRVDDGSLPMKRTLQVSKILVSACLLLAPACGSGFSSVGRDAGDGQTCQGEAPSCFNTSATACCLVNPYGPATCNAGEWSCGAALAPGCDESISKCGGPSCTGEPPTCCPIKAGACDCPSAPPFQYATCNGGALWTCGADEVLESVCENDAGMDGAIRNDGPIIDDGQRFDVLHQIECGPKTCMGQEVCVRTAILGELCLDPVDGGACPEGQVLVGECCDMVTYACAKRPPGCGLELDCACAEESLCKATKGGMNTCTGVMGDQVDCYLQEGVSP